MLVTDEQQQIADAVREFAQERLRPFAEQWDKAHRFPREAVDEMAGLGLFGMLVPEQYLSLIHISEPTRQCCTSRMPSSA